MSVDKLQRSRTPEVGVIKKYEFHCNNVTVILITGIGQQLTYSTNTTLIYRHVIYNK